MNGSLADHWRTHFWSIVQQPDHAQPLKEASVNERLGDWTKELTAVSVATSQALGWQAAAKGHRLELLPEAHSEYLGLDVMAFADGATRWRFPVAAIELENSRKDDRIAYSLWKVLSVRADLRIVFCYRRNGEEIPALLRHLREEVIEAMGLAGRVKLEGTTLMVVGSRSESGTFPFGYFGWWSLDTNTGKFERM